MAVVLPAPPYKAPLVDSQGRITPMWSSFFKQFFLRAGGLEALSNTELEALQLSELEGLQDEVDTLQASLTVANATIVTLQSQVATLQVSSQDYENGRSYR